MADSIYNSEDGAVTLEGRYPVVDSVRGFYRTYQPGRPGMIIKDVAGKWTGEKRPPRKGEYYLSGALIATYRAPNDLNDSHLIARIVRIEVETKVIVTEFPLEEN